MRVKITRHILLPLLYGIAVAWLVVGAGAVVVLRRVAPVSPTMALIAVSALLLIALFPALRRCAAVYSQALRYHRAEYLYDLGNGMDVSKAVRSYEKKAKRAAATWLKRQFTRSLFSIVPVTFCALLMAGATLFVAVEVAVLVAVMVLLAVGVALYTMLYAARHYCYDKYGNIKNAS